ncbi:hypothetical protein GCM10010885_07280 [Alicyclobacillus cellulosilyticus]|uniref:Uncharacterized protein n=1 Tax=Alicyclobacillus cellulosilyticus TaxID=1003997 RepID=A0A917K4E8_9BACL|nr:hypothetical protein GCM10010885_07280 [Alicyclobacillus cellulosilyticus]
MSAAHGLTAKAGGDAPHANGRLPGRPPVARRPPAYTSSTIRGDRRGTGAPNASLASRNN